MAGPGHEHNPGPKPGPERRPVRPVRPGPGHQRPGPSHHRPGPSHHHSGPSIGGHGFRHDHRLHRQSFIDGIEEDLGYWNPCRGERPPWPQPEGSHTRSSESSEDTVYHSHHNDIHHTIHHYHEEINNIHLKEVHHFAEQDLIHPIESDYVCDGQRDVEYVGGRGGRGWERGHEGFGGPGRRRHNSGPRAAPRRIPSPVVAGPHRAPHRGPDRR